MSSQSAPHRTAHGAYTPAKHAPAPKVNDSSARVSWWWLPVILAGMYLIFAYGVEFAANLLLDIFP